MKRIFLAVILLILISSCAEYRQQQESENYYKGLQLANTKVAQAERTCSAQYPKPMENATCVNDATNAAYQEAHFPYMDLVNVINAKRVEIAERVEAKKITPAQGKLELVEYINSKIEIARQRTLETQKLEAEERRRKADLAAAFLASGAFRPAPPIQPVQPYMMPVQKPINCNSFMAGNNISTSCY